MASSGYTSNYYDDTKVDAAKRNGCFVKKSTVYIVCFIFVLVLVGVACLFYFVPDRSCDEDIVNYPGDNDGLPQIPEESPDSPDLGDYDGRLPTALDPQNYWLRLQVYLDAEDRPRQFEYDGQVKITLLCEEATDVIKLHQRFLTIDYASISVTKISTGQTLEIKNSSPSDDRYEFLIIEMEDMLEVNEQYLLSITFIGELSFTILYGFYRSYYTVETESGTETRWLATTQFQAAAARKAFPCFDEPSFKSTFDVILVHRPTRSALSNMEEIRQVEIDNGEWFETHFDTSVPMPVYLIAFLISDFEHLEMYTPKGVLFRVWARPEYIHSANYSMYAGSKILTSFADTFEQPYQLTKMDMAAIPQFSAGAMENWGLVLYRESAMLYDPEVNMPDRREYVASIVAHELGHMWFGNQVTMDWWDHLWLNEGFATYSEYTGINEVEPEFKPWDTFLTYAMYSALRSDSSSSSSNPLVRETGWLLEANMMFDTMSYSKGGCLIRQFQCFLDRDVILQGLKDYLERYKYDNVVTDDLWEMLTLADRGRGNTNVKLVMDTWSLQAGHPIVTVTRSSPEVAHLTQERFFSDPNDDNDYSWPDLGYTWYVPITYTAGIMGQEGLDNPHRAWMNKEPAEIDLSDVSENDWILMNINKTGFYRVNYDDDNWNKLAEQLRDDHEVIPTQSRASLLDDAFRVSQTFHTDHVNALKLTEYLHEEKEYIPWDLIYRVLPYTDQMFLRTAEYGMHENYWRYLVYPSYEHFGWNFKESQHLDYYHRDIAIEMACHYNYINCTDQAVVLFHQWMQDTENNSISVEVRSAVYCAALRHGGLTEWEFVYERAGDEGDSTELGRLESALGCTKDAWLLQRYMEDYHSKDMAAAAIGNCRDKSAQGFSTAWMYTLTQFDSLLERYNVTAYSIVWDFAPWMNTDYDLQQLLAFGRQHSDMPESAASGFYNSVEKVETNIKWMMRNKESVENWLSEITTKIGLVI
ncbi:aminopeptidase N-like [Glandiceps talaboti]